MPALTFRTLQGFDNTLAEDMISAFEGRLRGRLVTAGDDYEQARTIWNAMIDRRPSAIVLSAGPRDVMATVRFANENNLLLAIKGGGHQIAGNAVHDGVLLLDLSGMDSVHVDPANRRADSIPAPAWWSARIAWCGPAVRPANPACQWRSSRHACSASCRFSHHRLHRATGE